MPVEESPPLPAGATYCVGDVVDHDGRLGTPVVHGSQAVVALLAGCVPDLKLYRGVIQTDGLSEEGSWEKQQQQRSIRQTIHAWKITVGVSSAFVSRAAKNVAGGGFRNVRMRQHKRKKKNSLTMCQICHAWSQISCMEAGVLSFSLK